LACSGEKPPRCGSITRSKIAAWRTIWCIISSYFEPVEQYLRYYPRKPTVGRGGSLLAALRSARISYQ
jgi:hypothetical protein